MEYFFGMPACADKAWCTEMASVSQWCKGKGLDPGAGHRTFSPDVLTMDMISTEAKIKGRAESLPFADCSFDFVITSHLIEHIQDTRGVLREWLRVVKPGGYVCCIVPNTLHTRGMNTDATPHLHEWGPREFMEDVFSHKDLSKPWWKLRPIIAKAEVVSFDEALAGWSFHLVLRRTDGIGTEGTAGK